MNVIKEHQSVNRLAFSVLTQGEQQRLCSLNVLFLILHPHHVIHFNVRHLGAVQSVGQLCFRAKCMNNRSEALVL